MQNCIGATSCVMLAPNFFKINNDNKAELTNAKEVDGKMVFEGEIDDSEFEKLKEASVSCPVQVIQIEEIN